jgi:PKD repeat protein
MKTSLLQTLRRATVAVALTLGFATGLSAQNGPCNQPPVCIVNNELGNNGSGGDVNSSFAATVNGWYVSHGTPTIFGNDCPTSTNNSSIWMWSYLNSTTQQGEGVYTCYDFRAGRTYTVCLWVRNTNAVSNGGRLRVLAANGLTNIGPASSSPIATPTSSQLIANSFTNNQTWTLETYTFTANQNFAELWIYPLMAAPPVNNQQYELQIDDIRVTPVIQPANISVTASPQNITWCQTSTLSVNNAPAGSTVSWAPSTGLSSTTGLSVLASPCATTTYTATVTVPGGNPNCPSCGNTGGVFTYTQTVFVTPPAFQITGNPNINCGDNLSLGVTPAPFCKAVSYTWTGPNGFVSVGSSFNIGPADPSYAGTYTLQITNQNGGCSYVYTVDVTVNCPCDASPDFYWNGCNPITFYGINNGSSPVITWFWEFGDGQTSTQQNPTHYYATGGTYEVCLTILATNNNGETCCNRICYTVDVCDPSGCEIFPAFGTQIDYASYTVFFNDQSTGTGTACDWFWDFGDGNTDAGNPNPVHSYGGPGFYYVCLTVTFCVYDADGNQIDKCETVYCRWIVIDQQFTQRLATDKKHGDDMVKIFPNPASDELFIAATENLQPTVRVMSVSGQEVAKASLSGKNLYSVNVSGLAPGLYMVEVLYPDGTAKHVQFVKD